MLHSSSLHSIALPHRTSSHPTKTNPHQPYLRKSPLPLCAGILPLIALAAISGAWFFEQPRRRWQLWMADNFKQLCSAAVSLGGVHTLLFGLHPGLVLPSPTRLIRIHLPH